MKLLAVTVLVVLLAAPLAVRAGAPIDVSLQASPLGDALAWRWAAAVPGRRVEARSLDGTPLGP